MKMHDYTRLTDVENYAKLKGKPLRILVWCDIIKAYKDASEKDKRCNSVLTTQVYEGTKNILCFLHKSIPLRRDVK